jgi:hypothetical protein
MASSSADLDGRGCRDVLVYCELLWYNHSAVMNADALADEMPVRCLCPGSSARSAA